MNRGGRWKIGSLTFVSQSLPAVCNFPSSETRTLFVAHRSGLGAQRCPLDSPILDTDSDRGHSKQEMACCQTMEKGKPSRICFHYILIQPCSKDLEPLCFVFLPRGGIQEDH